MARPRSIPFTPIENVCLLYIGGATLARISWPDCSYSSSFTELLDTLTTDGNITSSDESDSSSCLTITPTTATYCCILNLLVSQTSPISQTPAWQEVKDLHQLTADPKGEEIQINTHCVATNDCPGVFKLDMNFWLYIQFSEHIKISLTCNYSFRWVLFPSEP